MTIPRFLLTLFFLLLFGCASQTVTQNDREGLHKNEKPANAGYMLRFVETRSEESERSVRMIITDQFLRIDEGRQSKDFVLFNRENKTIARVVKNEMSIYHMNKDGRQVKPAYPLQWVIESQVSQVLMRTGENNQTPATHYRFYLNGELCYNLVAIENHLTETMGALREYKQVLANERKGSYRAAEGGQCSEAVGVFDPSVRLQNGFPLREWSSYGYQRFLVDYQKDVVFPDSLFRLP